MTTAGVEALRAEIAALLAHLDRIVPERAVHGDWTELDVGRHLVDLLARVTERDRWPSKDDVAAARSADGLRTARDRWPDAAAVRAGIEAVGPVALRDLGSLQEPVSGDALLHFGSAGQHPRHLWADGLVYEFVVHGGFDLGIAPRPGSVPPSLAWLWSSIPQVCAEALLAAADVPVAIVVTEARPSVTTLWRVGDGVAVGSADAVPGVCRTVIETDAWTLLGVASGRRPAEALLARTTGDRERSQAVAHGLCLGD